MSLPSSLARPSRKRVCVIVSYLIRFLTCRSVVRRQPTSVSVVSLSEAHAERASEVFHQPWFRWFVIRICGSIHVVLQQISYTGYDPVGVELAGALKNVYAIAAGMADGLGFENNTRASELERTRSVPPVSSDALACFQV